MSKNLPKLIKNTFPSDKQWTGVGFESYGGLRLPFASIGVNITGLVKVTYIFVLDLRRMRERLTKVPPVMSTFCAFVKKPEPES